MVANYRRTRKINLVLFGGKASAGKTTAAKYLEEKILNNYPGIQVLRQGLAQPIKDLAFREFGWDGKKDGKGRRLLQVLGTEAGREYNENLWVKKLEDIVISNVFPPSFVLVDDWRFDNEKTYFDNNLLFEVTSVGIFRGDGLQDKNAAHASENGIPDPRDQDHLLDYYDFVIDNSADLHSLEQKLDDVYAHLEVKIIKEA